MIFMAVSCGGGCAGPMFLVGVAVWALCVLWGSCVLWRWLCGLRGSCGDGCVGPVCLVALTVWTIYSHPHETHGVHTATYPHKTHGVHTATSTRHTGYTQLPPEDGKQGICCTRHERHCSELRISSAGVDDWHGGRHPITGFTYYQCACVRLH
jgi:hypothetical protein